METGFILIKISKTIYDEPDKSDGKRILVMTMWPRGIKKGQVDIWMKELGTPRHVIKKWKTGTISWAEVQQEYSNVLRKNHDRVLELKDLSSGGDITLLCSCRSAERCHRTLLANALSKMRVGTR